MNRPAMRVGVVDCSAISVYQVLDQNGRVVPRLIFRLAEENFADDRVAEENLSGLNLKLVLLVLFVE